MNTMVLSKKIRLPLNSIRAAALVLQLIYLFWLVQSPKLAIWVIMAMQLVVLMNQFFYRNNSSRNVLMGYLIADAVLMATYVYFTGGATNPLISLLLLPVITGSVLLCFRTSFVVLMVVNACYALIWWTSQKQHDHHMDHGYGDHLIGMWLVFVATSCLVYFVMSYLSRINQQQQQLLNRQKQRQIRDEHIMALGLSAADAAHQFNTPLSTLAVSVEDLLEQSDDELSASVAIMKQQIARCNEITQNMAAQYKQLTNHEFEKISVKKLLDLLAAKYRLLHPQTALNISSDSGLNSDDLTILADLKVRTHLGLLSAFLNILDNATKASESENHNNIRLMVEKNTTSNVIFNIIDSGKGVASDLYQRYGLLPSEASKDGMGFGSLVSSASIERVGGSLAIANHPDGGAMVSVTLPLVS